MPDGACILNASRAETLQAPEEHIDTQVEEQMNEISRVDWKRYGMRGNFEICTKLVMLSLEVL
jgi:hypothetical protein